MRHPWPRGAPEDGAAIELVAAIVEGYERDDQDPWAAPPDEFRQRVTDLSGLTSFESLMMLAGELAYLCRNGSPSRDVLRQLQSHQEQRSHPFIADPMRAVEPQLFINPEEDAAAAVLVRTLLQYGDVNPPTALLDELASRTNVAAVAKLGAELVRYCDDKAPHVGRDALNDIEQAFLRALGIDPPEDPSEAS